MGDILILGVLAVVIGAVIRKMIRDKKTEKSCCTGCSGTCGSCPCKDK